MLRFIKVIVLLLICATAFCGYNLNAPQGSLYVTLEDSAGTTTGALTLRSNGTSNTLASIPLKPKRLSEPPIALWNSAGDEVAIALFYGKAESNVYALVNTSNGYRVIDLAGGVLGNLGKFGEPETHWKQIRNEPVTWEIYPNQTEKFIKLQTRCWDKNGKRFTVWESILIRDGEPQYR